MPQYISSYIHAFFLSSIRPSVPVFLFPLEFFFVAFPYFFSDVRRGPIQHHILHAQSRQSSVACMLHVSYCTVQYSTVWLWLHYHGLCLCVPAQFFTISVWCILFVLCTEREISDICIPYDERVGNRRMNITHTGMC